MGYILLLPLLSFQLDVQPCYLLPPINSNYLPCQIRSHTHALTHRRQRSSGHTQSGQTGVRKRKKSEILPLSLIYSRPTQDKLHSGVIRADLAWFTRYGRDRISMIRAKEILRSIFLDGMKINKTLFLINTGAVGLALRMLMRRSAAATHRSAPPPLPRCYRERRLC